MFDYHQEIVSCTLQSIYVHTYIHVAGIHGFKFHEKAKSVCVLYYQL